ncbi:hypothetical protein B0T10DRAFT_553354 [Thelonectria olida]|uniref:Uncharacterized protein n=1 Tax=Thelonectria olida TaxID=1576542 RepID=A0A9P8VPI8_9HYPO|nr:hypothetical protein B0T10DRAFT_553354 [Thelonectria olida]
MIGWIVPTAQAISNRSAFLDLNHASQKSLYAAMEMMARQRHHYGETNKYLRLLELLQPETTNSELICRKLHRILWAKRQIIVVASAATQDNALEPVKLEAVEVTTFICGAEETTPSYPITVFLGRSNLHQVDKGETSKQAVQGSLGSRGVYLHGTAYDASQTVATPGRNSPFKPNLVQQSLFRLAITVFEVENAAGGYAHSIAKSTVGFDIATGRFRYNHAICNICKD